MNRDQYINHLKYLFNDFSNTIPTEILSSISPDNKFKVRKNWWFGLYIDLKMMIYDGLIQDPQIIEEIENFLVFPDSRLTTKNDIGRANRIIEIVLSLEDNLRTVYRMNRDHFASCGIVSGDHLLIVFKTALSKSDEYRSKEDKIIVSLVINTRKQIWGEMCVEA